MIYRNAVIDLVTVFDAIVMSWQTHEKLQCLYENLMSNNFRRMVCPLVKMASKTVTRSIVVRKKFDVCLFK